MQRGKYDALRDGAANAVNEFQPYTIADCLWCFDTRNAVDAGGQVASVQDLKVPTRTWTRIGNGFLYSAGPPRLGLGDGTSRTLRFVDAGADTPATTWLSTTSWTVLARLRIDWPSLGGTFDIWQDSFNRRRLRLVKTGTDCQLAYFDNGVSILATSIGTSLADSWATLGYWSDGANIRLYLNGAQISTTAFVCSTTTPPNLGMIGICRHFDYGANSGYTRALSGTEITQWHDYYATLYA